MSKRHIHIVSQFQGSLNEITVDLIEGLKDTYVVTREGDDEPKEYDILLCHFIIPKITQNDNFDRFKYRILIQPIDGTSIKRDIIKEINKFDVIITPGEAGKKILQDNNINKPIFVIPNFYKKEDLIKEYGNKKLDKLTKGKFVFYHESTLHPRKGIKELLRAYTKTFSSNHEDNKVVLILKCPPHNPATFESLEEFKKEVIALQKQYKYPAQIYKISQWLDKTKMRQLMTKCDCYIQPSKIEGFGIPLLRALILEKQTIVLNNPLSGYMDYLPKENVIYVKGIKEIAVGEINPMYTEVTEWYTPDEESLSTAMITSYNGHKEDMNVKSIKNWHLYENIIGTYKMLLGSNNRN